MIKVENIQVTDFAAAFRGLRNPKNSWAKSDSIFTIVREIDTLGNADQVAATYLKDIEDEAYTILLDKYTNILLEEGSSLQLPYGHEIESNVFIGYNDMKLAQRMIAAGTDESKFMRQIHLSMDITAPLCFWKEFDTYKVGTVANSCSTMHTITDQPITRQCFGFDHWINEWSERDPYADFTINEIITNAEWLRQKYLETEDKNYWRLLIEILPDSWLQKRTISMNYQVARAMYFARRYHKQQWWRDLCKVFEDLPYGRSLICFDKSKFQLGSLISKEDYDNAFAKSN